MAKKMTKAHKLWSYGAFFSMMTAIWSGYDGKQRKAHKYLAWISAFCMFMAVYTGHKMIHRKPKKAETAVTDETPEEI